MSGEQICNGIEAAFWLLLAISTATAGQRAVGFTTRRQVWLTVFLIGFGVSDLWEIFSGAWWKPIWLLVLKATCLTGMIVTACLIYAARWFPANEKG